MTRENFEKAQKLYSRVSRVDNILSILKNPTVKSSSKGREESDQETLVVLSIDDEHTCMSLNFTKSEIEVLKLSFIKLKEELLDVISDL